MDVSHAVAIETEADFDAWLVTHSAAMREVVVWIYKKASGRQTVTLSGLQEVALCHGWVDTQTKRIDADRYALRFTPRRRGSHWSDKNRAMARRLRAEGRLRPAGLATLPGDL